MRSIIINNQFIIDVATDCLSFVVQDGGSKYAASEGMDYGCVFSPCHWTIAAQNTREMDDGASSGLGSSETTSPLVPGGT